MGWNMEVQLPHDYVKFMISFGISLPSDTPELDEPEIDKMAKYVSVFVDLTAYFLEIKRFTSLETALACVICS